MRDIKFRAFNGDRMVKVNTIGWVDGEIDWVDTSKNDDFDEGLILMQYTGLKDKKGVEIYEGDIVKRTYLDGMFGRTHIGEVVYDKEYARYVISKPNKFIEPKTEDLGNMLSYRSTYEVIGNIHNNPELLEG